MGKVDAAYAASASTSSTSALELDVVDARFVVLVLCVLDTGSDAREKDSTTTPFDAQSATAAMELNFMAFRCLNN